MANVLTSDPPAIPLFDEAVAVATREAINSVKEARAENVANLLVNELFALVRGHETVKVMEQEESRDASVKFSAVNGEQLGVTAAMLADGSISSTMAKQLIRILYTEERGQDARKVANDRGFRLIQDAQELESICRGVIFNSPEEMAKYRMGGKFARKITKFLLGKAMQESSGNAHPERLNEVMLQVLAELAPTVER